MYSREVRCAMTILRENGNEKFEGLEPTTKFIKIIDDGIQAMTSHDAKSALYFENTCEQKKVIKNIILFIELIKNFHLAIFFVVDILLQEFLYKIFLILIIYLHDLFT